MAEPSISLTKQDLQDLITAAITASNKLNPIEQKEYEKKVAAEKRRLQAMIELGRIEEKAQRDRENGCSHSRYPAGSGKLAGHSCPRGQGEWVTGSHIHNNGIVSVICLRCSTIVQYRATEQEKQYILDSDGGAGMPFPPAERILKSCNHCNDKFAGTEYHNHIGPCEKKLAAQVEALVS